MHEKHANTYDPERITKNYRYSRNTTKVRNIMSHCNYWLSSRSNRLLCGRLQRRHRRSWKWVGSTQHGPCHRNNVTYKRAPWCSKQLSCLSLSEETDEFSDSLGRFKSWAFYSNVASSSQMHKNESCSSRLNENREISSDFWNLWLSYHVRWKKNGWWIRHHLKWIFR